MLPLKVINLFAGPGAGKSTTAAGLFNLMKNLGLRVELVTEVAKDLTYERSADTLSNQLFILGQQDQRLRRLVGQVDWVVTDSPLLLGLAYLKPEYLVWLPDAISGAFRRYDNHNVFINRVKPYATYGRSQTEEEAKELDDTLRHVWHHAPGPRVEVAGDANAPFTIANALELTPRAR